MGSQMSLVGTFARHSVTHCSYLHACTHTEYLVFLKTLNQGVPNEAHNVLYLNQSHVLLAAISAAWPGGG